TGSPETSMERWSVLLFATREGGRMAIPLSQVARLEEFPYTALEQVGPLQVVQYRDEILPLINVSRVLRHRYQQGNNNQKLPRRKAPRSANGNSRDTVQVVVYAAQGQRVGLVVDQILDIVEEEIVSRSPARRPGVLFTAVIQGRVTEFLD